MQLNAKNVKEYLKKVPKERSEYFNKVKGYNSY